jgi:hypothetical protein
MLGDRGVCAKDVAERAGWDRVRTVSEVVVATPGYVCDADERAAAWTSVAQQRYLVTEVVADERKCEVGQSGG